MKKFLKQLFTFSSFGIFFIVILLAGYLYFDPFKVLRSYKDYSYSFVISSRDYISTEVFRKNYKKYSYNSFIFGSSRTLAFRAKFWIKYLPENARPYIFDASVESIEGIYSKIRYLNSIPIKIDNALIVLDRDGSFGSTRNFNDHLYIKSPLTSGESNLNFQLTFLKAYFNFKFLINFYDYIITRKYKPYMKGYIENKKLTFDTITNQLTLLDLENEIQQDPIRYYSDRKEIFYHRKGEQTDNVRRIKNNYISILNEIKSIFKLHNTNYKIVLSPLYEQIKFNPYDVGLLERIFPGHVFDFSGKNQFTDSINNYYEGSHYRPIVGNEILKIIYNNESKKGVSNERTNYKHVQMLPPQDDIDTDDDNHLQ